jgi:hypothetical protein
MVIKRPDHELLELIGHLKLSCSFDASISQKTGKPPKFSGRSFVKCLTMDFGSASSPEEAEEILRQLVQEGYLLRSSGTSNSASPIKDKVHYRFNDVKISANHRRASSSPKFIRSSTSSSLPSTSLSSNEENRERNETFRSLQYFALTFVSINLYHYVSLYYPHDSFARFILTFFLASASVALLSLNFGGSKNRR